MLVGIEVGRIDDPHEHILAVGGLHPAFLHIAHRQLGKNLVVDGGDLLGFARGGVNAEEFRWVAHRLATGNQFFAVPMH